MGHTSSIGSFTQQSLPSFEHVVAFPQQHTDEPWAEFVGRVQLWDREKTERAQASGAYRAVPYVPGLDPVCRGLFVSLAWHSFSEGLGQYAPVRLSERALAALMGDTSSHAKHRAAVALKALVAAGAVEVLEEARGPKPRLLRVRGLCPTTQTKSSNTKGSSPPAQVKREDRGEKERSASLRSQGSEPDHASLVRDVVSRLGGALSASTVRAMIDEHGATVVQQQYEWFPYRDTSKFRRGPGVAFQCFCRGNDEEPESVKAGRLAEEAAQRRREEEARRQREEQERRERENAHVAAVLAAARAHLTPEAYAQAEELARQHITRRFGAKYVDCSLNSILAQMFQEHCGVRV